LKRPYKIAVLLVYQFWFLLNLCNIVMSRCHVNLTRSARVSGKMSHVFPGDGITRASTQPHHYNYQLNVSGKWTHGGLRPCPGHLTHHCSTASSIVLLYQVLEWHLMTLESSHPYCQLPRCVRDLYYTAQWWLDWADLWIGNYALLG